MNIENVMKLGYDQYSFLEDDHENNAGFWVTVDVIKY